MTRHTLKPRPPVRAFVLVAVLSLVAAAFIVLGAAKGLAWLTGLGIFAAAAALALLLLAAGSLRTMRVHVDLDDDGYHITGPRIDKAGRWADVTKVAIADGGARLVLYHGEVERTHLWCPLGADDPAMQALISEVTRRMDASRGYTNLV